MSLIPTDSGERKRVKVYELRNNDWFDRGTGFCTGRVIGVRFRHLLSFTPSPPEVPEGTKSVPVSRGKADAATL